MSTSQSRPARPGPLAPEQLAHFEREGYLILDHVFTDADLQPVIDELNDEIDRRSRKLVASGDLSKPYEEDGFLTRLGKISAETDKLALSIWNGVLSGPAIFELIRHPALVDIAEQFCGPEIVASSVYRVRPKIPNHVMGPVPWHQDSGYFEPYCDQALVLTVWLPLVDSNVENGCLWVLPRAHKEGVVFRHAHRENKPYLAIPREDLREDRYRPIPAEVNKGGILLLHNLTPHASFDNNTDIVRWSMDLRYQSAALPTNAAITRLPGEITGTEDGTIPGACYPPEADFLVRSAARPDEVVKDAATFHRIRHGYKSLPISRKWGHVIAD